MNKSKNLLALTLMISSIALLLVLQLFWLQSSYERAFFGLRRESNFVFRNTAYALRDSLYQGSIRAVGIGDSIHKIQGHEIQSINVIKNGIDTVSDAGLRSSTVQVFVSGKDANKDSVLNAIRPLSRQLKQSMESGQKSFTIRLAPDTLSMDTLKKYFHAGLKRSNIPVDFVIGHQKIALEKFHAFRPRPDSDADDDQIHVYSDTIQLEGFRFNPMTRYNASIFPIQSFILKQIAPQIVFSFLLTVITIIAFVILYRNVRAQQRLMVLKNDFISNVTHELKTPVATVSVALEALKSFHALNDPKLTKEYLDIAQNELNRLTLMTDKILKASVFESRGIVIQKEAVDLRKVIAQILDSMRLLFEKRQAHVAFDQEGDSFSIAGEHAHITNVIYNLLDNALKYSLTEPVIAITLKETADEIILSVKDSGLGIPHEYRKKIFEKFFRVPTGDVHNIKGYGLGLSYVAGVVKAHEGSIDVQSESGKGSTFIIHWPKHRA